jgi:sigma-B regulation protein RsbU (phosphoserine phosphatase)
VRDALPLVLDPGDTLVLYTDAVTGAYRSSGELFGLDRLGDGLQRRLTRQANEIVGGLLDDGDAHQDGTAQADDLVLVAIQRAQGSSDA